MYVNGGCALKQHTRGMISARVRRDDEKYLYNKQLKIALIRAIFIIKVNRGGYQFTESPAPVQAVGRYAPCCR